VSVVRALMIQLGVKDDASGKIQGIDESVDGMRDNIIDTQGNVSDLTDETSEFGYSATRDIQDVGSSTGELENQTRSLGDRFRGVADSIGRNWNAIAAGAGAAGAALEAFARQQQDMIIASEQLAHGAKVQAGEVRNMALELHDATFDLEDIYEVLTIARQRGLEPGSEAMKEFAETWDTVADASGEGVGQLAKGGIALQALGVEVGEEEEAFDALGFILRDTTASVTDFMHFIGRAAPDLQDMNMDVDEAAAVFGALEGELSLTAREARTEFRQALRESEGDMGVMLDTLGLTEDQLVDYKGQVGEASGVIEDWAHILYDAQTPAQHLQAEIAGLTHQYGAHFMPIIEMLSPALMGLGMAMGVAAGAKYVFGAAAIAAGGWIVAAFAAVIGIGWLLYDNWGTITEYFGDVWERATQRVDDNLETIRALPGDMKTWGQDMIQGLSDGIDSGIDWLRGSISGVRDTIVGGITDFFGISSPSSLMMEYGVNLGEGLELGLEKESRSMLDNMGRSFNPERDGQLQAAGAGAFAPQVSINVNGSSDPEGTAQAVDRRLRQTFDTYANRYFSRQRRKRPKK